MLNKGSPLELNSLQRLYEYFFMKNIAVDIDFECSNICCRKCECASESVLLVQSCLLICLSWFIFTGPGVAGYLTAGTGSTVISNVPPPVDNDVGDLG